jgi:arylsulfatase A-like enzyme
MYSQPNFRSTITSLWFRFVTVAIVGLAFIVVIDLANGRIQGWSFYLTTSEIIFEFVVRLVFAALAGIVFGTACTVILSPVLWYFDSSRARIAGMVVSAAVVAVVFLDSRYALNVLIKSWWSNHGPRFTTALLTAHILAFVVALCIPRARKALVESLDGFLGKKTMRRIVIATFASSVVLVALEFVLAKTSPVAKAVVVPQRPKSNFVLVTFDAFSAEDISLYGYKLPTTPNIDAFARRGTIFTNFYSSSTYTTPSIGVILTGVYPSENYIYGLSGQVPAANVEKNLPYVLRASGFRTGAFMSNPWAYSLAKSVKNEFDVLPEPVFHPGGFQRLWEVTSPLHQDTGFGSRITEYFDLETVWDLVAGAPPEPSFRYRASASFAHAKEILDKLPDGYFLWVHVLAPHHPYLPDPADQGRFIPQAELLSFEAEPWLKWKPTYPLQVQPQVDRHRLAYDEYIATADRDFGAFMADLESSGKLQNTTIIVSADHGESFEGGIYQHESPYQTRPEIHIPLIIRTPGQQNSSTVSVTADQTALAATILELAGLTKPEWLRGQSLVGWLGRDGEGAGEGLAFTQHLERNSIFRPLHHGTVGVIDGKYQYVLDLETQKGWLRPLNEAQYWNVDRSAEDPARAEALRAAIYSRFPYLPRKEK